MRTIFDIELMTGLLAVVFILLGPLSVYGMIFLMSCAVVLWMLATGTALG